MKRMTKLNMSKMGIGLLFLTVALILVQGASALSDYSQQNDPNFPALHSAAASPGCAGGCHTSAATWPDDFCGTCHQTNPFAATPTPTATTPTPTTTTPTPTTTTTATTTPTTPPPPIPEYSTILLVSAGLIGIFLIVGLNIKRR